MFFSVHYMVELFPQIVEAIPVTLSIVIIATLGGLVFGLFLAYVRLEHIIGLNWISSLYVSFIQGTPIIVQLFVVYYGAPTILAMFGIDVSGMSKISFMYIAYGFNSAAYFGEIIRAAINDVPASQFDAAYAIGLTKFQAYERFIIPQAIKEMVPNVEVSVVSLLQNSSLATYLGIYDVMGKAQLVGTNTSHQIEAFIDAMFIFMVLSLVIHGLFSIHKHRQSETNDNSATVTNVRSTSVPQNNALGEKQ